jgi:hypothetical protein
MGGMRAFHPTLTCSTGIESAAIEVPYREITAALQTATGGEAEVIAQGQAASDRSCGCNNLLNKID